MQRLLDQNQYANIYVYMVILTCAFLTVLYAYSQIKERTLQDKDPLFQQTFKFYGSTDKSMFEPIIFNNHNMKWIKISNNSNSLNRQRKVLSINEFEG